MNACRFISRKASWKGRHSGGSTDAGSTPRSWARRCRAAIAMARLARRTASNAAGSFRSPNPASMRDAARVAPCSRSTATSACGSSWGADCLWTSIHERYCDGNDASAARSVATSGTAASASIPSSTSGISAGFTRSTSACGIHVVSTRRQKPLSSTTLRVAVPWPTANSIASRYCNSAIRSSASFPYRPRGLGRGTNGRSASTVSCVWNAKTESLNSSGPSRVSRRLTRNTDTARVPAAKPGRCSRRRMRRTDVTISRPLLLGRAAGDGSAFSPAR